MRTSLAMLVYNRPVHAGLSLGFALANKAENTGLHVFYSIHRSTTPPSRSMDNLLRTLRDSGCIQFHYLHDDKPQSCGGNVDTLMTTMCSDARYDCFMKIDDDVLIGEGTDTLMANTLLDLEQHKVMFLMGQAVRHHMRMSRPFAWETTHNDLRIVQRARKACPMETYTAVNPAVMKVLLANSKSTLCEDNKGTFMPYTRKVTDCGYKSALVLSPAITMQHIGLTSTIDSGADRNWAPATSWDKSSDPIKVPHFDFEAWEKSHSDNTQKDFALSTLVTLRDNVKDAQRANSIDHIIGVLKQYTPGENDVPLPSAKASSPGNGGRLKVLRRDGTKRVTAQGTMARRGTAPKRRIVRKPRARVK